MSEMNNLVKLALDTYHKTPEQYSVKETSNALREAMIELNNNSTKLDYKAIRDGKCVGLFNLIEEVLDQTIPEGLMEDDFFTSMVDFRNVAMGDKNEFLIEDQDYYYISKIAGGSQALRRQRLSGYTKQEVATDYRGVKIYEELNRILSGQVDFNHMIDWVSRSFRQNMLNEIYSLWTGLTYTQLGGIEFFPAAGPYNESTLLSTIEHVEAVSGKTATIIGTKAALRALVPSIAGDMPKDDLYNLGYFGKFYGSPVVAIPQRHKIGSNNFQFNDKEITIVASDLKPLKFVYEGDSTIIMGDPTQNADMTQNYVYLSKYGMGLVMAHNTGIGKYIMT